MDKIGFEKIVRYGCRVLHVLAYGHDMIMNSWSHNITMNYAFRIDYIDYYECLDLWISLYVQTNYKHFTGHENIMKYPLKVTFTENCTWTVTNKNCKCIKYKKMNRTFVFISLNRICILTTDSHLQYTFKMKKKFFSSVRFFDKTLTDPVGRYASHLTWINWLENS